MREIPDDIPNENFFLKGILSLILNFNKYKLSKKVKILVKIIKIVQNNSLNHIDSSFLYYRKHLLASINDRLKFLINEIKNNYDRDSISRFIHNIVVEQNEKFSIEIANDLMVKYQEILTSSYANRKYITGDTVRHYEYAISKINFLFNYSLKT